MTPIEQYQRLAREVAADFALTAKASSGVLSPEYLDGRIAALIAAAVELVIAELQSLDDEHQTYAQWVLEREEPVGYDKTVIRADHIHARIAALRQPQRKRVEEDSDEEA